jgi:tetratricopeptide (TPR) repeat protein
MSADREERLGEIFSDWLEAVERGETPQRTVWLARHADFAPELEEMLAEEERLRSLAAPLRAAARAALVPAWDGPPSGPLGDCELLEEIGRGGTGVVYRARQRGLGRFVALKLCGAGLPGGDDPRRFRHEAETVARLDHPRIVPIYEVGEHGGCVYFTMKLIEGGGLDRSLGRFVAAPRATAVLLAEVARAVHHAHQRGVLHRDLKPSNVLLDGDGKGHVTDFGLARWLDADSGLTRTGAVVGTPAYMAPEQAAGRRDAVTVAADVYGLGAVLYALLTGRPPFVGASVLETLDQVRYGDPQPPRRLNPKADRDLETICLKCLHKEPPRRYESAAALADDLERWLRGEPILARPAGPLERLWCWCMRQPGQAGLAAGLLLAVAVGTALVVWQWRRAEDNYRTAEAQRSEAVRSKAEADGQARAAEERRREAEERKADADDSLRLAHEVALDFTTRLADGGQLEAHGLEPLQRELLRKAQVYLRKFLERRRGDPAFRRELAEASASLASIVRLTGSPEEALEEYRRALGLFEALADDDPASVRFRLEQARMHNHIGAVLDSLGRKDESVGEVRRARAILEETRRSHPDHFGVRYELAATLNNLGMTDTAAGRVGDALARFAETRAAYEELLREQPDNPDLQARLANTVNSVGIVLGRNNRGGEALVAFREAAGTRERLARRFPDDLTRQRELGESLCNVGDCLRENGQVKDGLDYLRRAEGVLDDLTRVSPHVNAYRYQLGLCRSSMGKAYLALNDPRRALDCSEAARQAFDRLVREAGQVPDYQGKLERVLLDLAEAHNRLDNREAARQALEQARDIEKRLADAFPDQPELSSRLGVTTHNLALNLAVQGRLADARTTLLSAVERQQRALAQAPANVEYRRRLATHYALLAQLQRDLSDPDAAAETGRRRLALWTDDGKELYLAARDLALTAGVRRDPEARRRDADLALDALGRAVRAGFRDAELLRRDAAWQALRDRDEWRRLAEMAAGRDGP